MSFLRNLYSLIGCAALCVSAVCAAGCEGAHDCGTVLDGPLPSPALVRGPLYAQNQQALQRLLSERAAATEEPEYWLALVPGSSEEWGHHRAPPREVEATGQLLSFEFQERLDRAYRLLADGTTRFLLISGGAIDAARPDYVEAERGRDYLVRTYAKSFSATEPLAARLLVDGLAMTTPENVRNADLLSVQLGLLRSLIITTMPQRSTLSPQGLSTQGYYLLEHEVSTFDSRCRSELGYTLGAFLARSFEQPGGAREPAIHHCQLNVSALRNDPLWQ